MFLNIHIIKEKKKIKTIFHGFYYCEYRGHCTFDCNGTTIFFPFFVLKKLCTYGH